MRRILIVDDEEGVCWALEQHLSSVGYEVKTTASAEQGIELIDTFHPNVIVMDIRLPGMDGLSALKQIKETFPNLPVIIITAHGTMQTAVEAVKRGAYEYLVKPLDLERSEMVIKRAFEAGQLNQEVQRLRMELIARDDSSSLMVGNTHAMQEVYKKIGAVSQSDSSVLITGESGTGKELAARAIHLNSDRRNGPFVVVNCAALPESLLENELYGHEKGAYTGAVAKQQGKFELANAGTIFLDEISEIPLAMQVKLLRFLENHIFERLGGTSQILVNVRVLAATNRVLEECIAQGSFREDLYYRLNVVEIDMPPLRERMGDIPLLVAHFMNIISTQGEYEISDDTINILKSYQWPGNIRELRNAVEHAVVLARQGIIMPEHLPENVRSGYISEKRGKDSPENILKKILAKHMAANPSSVNLHEEVIDEFDKPLIKEALAITSGNQVKAAEMLGIHRTTLRKKMDKFGIK